MTVKRPLCNYSGTIKELADTDTLPIVMYLPLWKINSDEVVVVGDRQEYAINSGVFSNAGTLNLGSETILFVGGAQTYTYIAYASDATGAGFTTIFNASLDYIAIKVSNSIIAVPQASDFGGLWKNYKGASGTDGTDADIGMVFAIGGS